MSSLIPFTATEPKSLSLVDVLIVADNAWRTTVLLVETRMLGTGAYDYVNRLDNMDKILTHFLLNTCIIALVRGRVGTAGSADDYHDEKKYTRSSACINEYAIRRSTRPYSHIMAISLLINDVGGGKGLTCWFA